MSLTCLKQVALEYVGGGSDKIYVVQVQQNDTAAGTAYLAVGYYGRNGSSLSRAEKYNGSSLASATAAADKLEREKRTKSSYTDKTVAPGARVTGMPSDAPVFGGASTGTPTPTAMKKAIVGVLPMLAKEADEARVAELLDDPDWGAQRKYDGERVTVSLRRSAIQAANRKGEARPLTAPAEAALKKLLAQTDFSDDRETVFDGELMGDEYVIYDIITLRDNDMKKMSGEERYSALEELLSDNLGLLAPMAWSPDEKRAMLARAHAEGWEGLIFRDLTAFYITGRSPSLLKHKLWATCTCRVLTANAQRSIQVAMRDEHDNEVFVGNVTVPVNQDIPDVDSLVEVRYLYAMEGGSLYQPTLQGVRSDLDDCDLRSGLRAAPPEKRGELAEAA
jgi:bifunctional non-homologous end joining protein LigD